MTQSTNSSILVKILLLTIVAASIIFTGMNSIVNTKNGIKIYPKSTFTFNDTYVDMSSMSFIGLRNHPDLVKIMVANGDTYLLPGGPTLLKAAEMGQNTLQVIYEFDNEFQVSSSINEMSRIGSEKFEELDKKYDIRGKTDKAIEKAKDGAQKFNQWLKEQ